MGWGEDMRGVELRDSHEAADYIATIAVQLAEMAAMRGWGTLVAIFDMARLEAELLRDRDDPEAASSSLTDDGDDTSAAVIGYGDD